MRVHSSLLDGNPRDTHNGLRSSANPLSGVISGPDQFCLLAPNAYIPEQNEKCRKKFSSGRPNSTSCEQAMALTIRIDSLPDRFP